MLTSLFLFVAIGAIGLVAWALRSQLAIWTIEFDEMRINDRSSGLYIGYVWLSADESYVQICQERKPIPFAFGIPIWHVATSMGYGGWSTRSKRRLHVVIDRSEMRDTLHLALQAYEALQSGRS